jgi:hypothetical protein
MTMTNEQVGKYIRLLCLQHQKGKLTLKDLKQYINEEDIEVAEKFIKDSDGFYYNIKLKNETERRKSYSESRRNNRMKNISKSYDKHMETVTGTETVTDTLELKLVTGNVTKAEREDILAEAFTGSIDKEQKELLNKFDNLFGNEK